jgi:hypothetical protein
MSFFQSSSVANWCYKLIPSITTFCVTLGAVGIYNNNLIKNTIMTNEISSNTSQIPGPQGPAGTQGETGPQGPKGDEGTTSASGAKGAAGPAGPQGATGAAGPAGPQGTTGAAGPAGPQGIAGPAGSSGSGGGSGFVVRDATGAIVEGFAFKDVSNIKVFRNGTMFQIYMGDGRFRAVRTTSFVWYATPNCTGARVAPSQDYYPNETLEILVYDTNNELINTLGPFKVGTSYTVGDVYRSYQGVCSIDGNYDSYYQMTEVTQPGNLPAPLYFAPN